MFKKKTAAAVFKEHLYFSIQAILSTPEEVNGWLDFSNVPLNKVLIVYICVGLLYFTYIPVYDCVKL